ncbi:MAG: SusF/SusE family outer membrane protein [Prevotella sp.]|nr:SusF/SusE family outer membrane protein [Prevotella sp.]
MKCIVITLLSFLAFTGLNAQSYNELWAVGTAVPGGAQKLEKVAEGDFKFVGSLNAGELRIQTQRKAGTGTYYLTPVLPDANIVSRGMAFNVGTDEGQAWQVVVSENRYRFHVDINGRTVRGEIVQPWGELFIAGGATDAGWKCEGKMLLMEQDIDNPFLWTWEGELKHHSDVEEGSRFKFQGQDRWGPKSLHPFVQDTDILKEQHLRTNGGDTKWAVTSEGRYRIAIDLLNETVNAKKIK